MRCRAPSPIVRPALVLAVATLLAAAGPAGAETRLGPFVVSGETEWGWHEISGNPDSAEFEEYRDAEQWVGRGRFRLEDEGRRFYLRGWFEDLAQGDEHYRLELGRWGHWELWGDFREIPHTFSTNARTPYRGLSDDTLVLPFGVLPGGLAARAATIDGSLRGQDLEFRSIYGSGGLSWNILENLEFSTDYRLIDKKGTIFRGGLNDGFAAGAGFANFASPVDEKIHELTAGVDWTWDGLSVSLDYVGNVYDNDVGDSLTVDNPFLAADAGNQSSRWRQALAPDNQSHTVSLAGAWILPVEIPARVTTTLSYGRRSQEDDFIPMTINSMSWAAGGARLVPSQDDLDGRVDTFLADFRFTSRPIPRLNVDGHYRYYDYDNDSDVIRLDALVVNDGGVDDEVPGAPDRFTVPNEYERQEAGLEATYRLFSGTTIGLGYEWKRWERSRDRSVRETDEHGPDVRIDVRPASWVQIRSRYSYRIRNRSNYAPFAFIEASSNPALVEEAEEFDVFREGRNFPQSALHGHEANVNALLQPCDTLSLGVSAGLQFDDYHRSDYGLRDDERWWAGADATWVPASWMDVSVYYTFDRWLLVQQSRFRNVMGFGPAAMVVGDVPANDWTSNTTEIAHNVGVDLGLTILPDRLWADVGYDYQRGTVRTRSGGNLVPPAEDFPTVRNSFHVVRTTLTYQATEMLKVKGYYRWERYVQQDHHLDDIRPFAPQVNADAIFLGNEVDDYRAHVYGATFVVEF